MPDEPTTPAASTAGPTVSDPTSPPVVAKALSDDLKLLVQQEIALAKLEVLGAVKRVGAAIGLFVTAGLLGLYFLGFMLGTVARALEGPLPDWAAWLVTTLLILVLMGVLALVGKSLLPDGAPAEATKAEAERTAALVKERAQATVQAFNEGRTGRGQTDQGTNGG